MRFQTDSVSRFFLVSRFAAEAHGVRSLKRGGVRVEARCRASGLGCSPYFSKSHPLCQ
jgi:hypothetical protein